MREQAELQPKPNGRAAAAAITGRERLMQTFRIPRDLVAFLKTEAADGGRDLTAHVVRWLEGMKTYFSLPEVARALLERDRAALGMDRFEYLLHIVYQRSLELRQRGPGFDAPAAPERASAGGDR